MIDPEMDGEAKKTGYELTEEYGDMDDQDEEEDDTDWSPSRRRLHRILRSTATDVVLGGIIAVSLAVVIIETDQTADNQEAPYTIQAMNIGFTVLYSFELAVRLYVYRLRFFCQWFNVMDFLIVAFDIGLKIISNSSIVSTLRIFRLAKLGRVLVLLEKFPELHMILRGIYCTIKSIFWGMCLLGTIILIWSILGTQLIHPINKNIDYGDCERCNRAFSSVSSTFLTIFQTVVAGDSWGTVAVPVIEKNPFAMIYFVIVFVSISLLVLNLILATTVERASAAKDEDQAELSQKVFEEKKKAYATAAKRLKAVCKEMDRDASGALTVDELQEGYRSNSEFHQEMKAMDIKQDDMETVFKLLDADRSGDVDYEEFVESLHMMKTRDSHTLLMFTHQLVEDILAKSSAEMRILTGKRDGLVNRIADEVTQKTLAALAPLLERSTKPSQEKERRGLGEAQDNEVPIGPFCCFQGGARHTSPPLKEEDMQVASEGLKAFRKEEVQSATRRLSSHSQEPKRGQPQVLAPSSNSIPPVVVPPLAPWEKEAEAPPAHRSQSHSHAGGSPSEGDTAPLADRDHESKLASMHEHSASFAAYSRKGNEESIDNPRPHEGTSTATTPRENAYSRLPPRWRIHRHHPPDMEEALARMTTTLQNMEQAIYSIGGAGRHAQWCPACAPEGGKDAKAGHQHHVTSI